MAPRRAADCRQSWERVEAVHQLPAGREGRRGDRDRHRAGDRAAGRPQAIKQILLNLMGNALKFSGAGGRITLSAFLLPGGRLGVEVADTGVRVPNDKLALVFEPYAAVGSDPALESTGLGLPLTNRLVEPHGGFVEMARCKLRKRPDRSLG